ncbi:microtubule-associated protein Jupiter [Topomyia yanbarensis]|uniref:microtubule-associated protein Jupiter n=1 Tax=Topomyia yanbarensis TaxID=2498891 RepID=UPI00273BAD04|nr:microtubule-associated protein Jupiter [Topomyia yanbarensis]XP_058836518.1 microtubule-associated protein Jupiter [Topomyia yanbarensis]XP_058836519.1 microtubule-associated protein Jupiter [Topomyia yanbarensis]
MSSTEFNIGITDEKTSSRVLKPPGGGHSDIFGSPEVKANPPRPKYNQQNSSNMNGVMGTIDPNLKVEQIQNDPEIGAAHFSSQANKNLSFQSTQDSSQTGGRGRVPPGGFSSGLW